MLHINAGNLFGGVETYLVTLAESRGLAPGTEPEYALCFPGRQRDELLAAGVPVHDLGAVRWSRPWTLWLARRRLRTLLDQKKYDIVVLHQPWIQAGFGRTAEAMGAPTVAYFHGPTGTDRFVKYAKLCQPRLVIAPSRDSLACVDDLFPGVARGVVNYPFSKRMTQATELAPEKREEIRRGLGASAEDVIIFQASRIESWKGPDVVIEALCQLRDLPNWKFWFAGAPQRKKEQELYQRMQVLSQPIADRVKFLGERSDVPDLMKAVDIYCQGNRGPEGFGLSFMEASYYGLPILTTDLGGAAEMIDASTGILTPPGDLNALVNGLRTLITDALTRREMGAGARAKAIRLCDTAQQLNLLKTLFAAALGNAP